VFLFLMMTTPKTHCQACSLQAGEDTISGYEAFQIFEKKCISYDNPWDGVELPTLTNNSQMYIESEPLYANIDNINVSYDKDGNQVLDIDSDDVMFHNETGLE